MILFDKQWIRGKYLTNPISKYKSGKRTTLINTVDLQFTSSLLEFIY